MAGAKSLKYVIITVVLKERFPTALYITINMIYSLNEGMGAVNQLQSQGLGMTKDFSKTSDDLVAKVRYVTYRRGQNVGGRSNLNCRVNASHKIK